VGIANSSASLSQYTGQNTNSWGIYYLASIISNGYLYNAGIAGSGYSDYVANDVIGFALNMDAGTLDVYKNGVAMGSQITGLTGTIYPAVGCGAGSNACTANFGASAFSYSVPIGYNSGLYYPLITALDSSLSDNRGALNGVLGDIGKIANCASFDTSDYIRSVSVINTNIVTISAWVYISATPSTYRGFVTGFLNAIDSAIYDKLIVIGTDGKPVFYVYDGASKDTSVATSSLSLNTWNYLVGTYDGATASMYSNGILVGTATASSTRTAYTVPNIFINGRTDGAVPGANGGNYLNGWIDEVRVSNIARSASWILTEYNNQNDPSTFYTIGATVSYNPTGFFQL